MADADRRTAFVSGGVLTGEICAALAGLGYSTCFLRDENPVFTDNSSEPQSEGTMAFKVRDFSASELSNAVIESVEEFGEMDLLVFVGGSQREPSGSMLLDIDDELWDSRMNRSARGFFLLVKYLLPYLISRPGSRIVVADISSDSPDAAAAAASAALEASAEQMTEELSACGISLSYKRTTGENTAEYITDVLTAKS